MYVRERTRLYDRYIELKGMCMGEKQNACARAQKTECMRESSREYEKEHVQESNQICGRERKVTHSRARERHIR